MQRRVDGLRVVSKLFVRGSDVLSLAAQLLRGCDVGGAGRFPIAWSWAGQGGDDVPACTERTVPEHTVRLKHPVSCSVLQGSCGNAACLSSFAAGHTGGTGNPMSCHKCTALTRGALNRTLICGTESHVRLACRDMSTVIARAHAAIQGPPNRHHRHLPVLPPGTHRAPSKAPNYFTTSCPCPFFAC